MTVFKPYPGKGAQYGTLFLVLSLGIFLIPIIQISKNVENPWAVIPMGILALGISGMFIYFSYAAATMKYIVDDGHLTIRWAFSEKKIALDSIGNVEKRMGITAFKTAGISWPGLHIGGFSVGDNHNVNLYATRLVGDVILFKTKWETVGITPEDPDLFLDELSRLLPGLESRVVDPRVGEEARKEAIHKNAGTFRILTAVNLVAIAATYLWVTLKIRTLPAKIPMNIGANGVVRYGSPMELYIMPSISLVIFLVMFVLARFYRGNRLASNLLLGAGIILTIVMNLSLVSILSM